MQSSEAISLVPLQLKEPTKKKNGILVYEQRFLSRRELTLYVESHMYGSRKKCLPTKISIKTMPSKENIIERESNGGEMFRREEGNTFVYIKWCLTFLLF